MLLRQIHKKVMADMPDQMRLPPGLATAGDPVDGNPFPIEHAAHRVWQEATLRAEHELCDLNSKELVERHTTLDEIERWAIDLCLKKFNIWAKRNIHVVWSEEEVRNYDQWLFSYAEAWLDSETNAGHISQGALLEFRLRLIESMEWWKGEARRYLAEQKKHAAIIIRNDARIKPPNAQRPKEWYDSTQDLVKRRQIVLKTPKLTAKKFCPVFDANRIPLPEGWEEEFGIRTWVEAYNKPKARNRIMRIISTDKAPK